MISKGNRIFTVPTSHCPHLSWNILLWKRKSHSLLYTQTLPSGGKKSPLSRIAFLLFIFKMKSLNLHASVSNVILQIIISLPTFSTLWSMFTGLVISIFKNLNTIIFIHLSELCCFSVLSLSFTGRSLRKCLALARRIDLKSSLWGIPSTGSLEGLHSFSKHLGDEELTIWKGGLFLL